MAEFVDPMSTMEIREGEVQERRREYFVGN
jgi:hypothetical protein